MTKTTMETSNDLNKKLYEKFFSDPDWVHVVGLFTKHQQPLLDMTTIDTSQPAEHVKAEVIARTLAHNVIADIVNESNVSPNKIAKVVNNYR